MLLRFFQRLSGRQVLLLAALSIVWFQGALLMTGLYPDHVRAQGGPPIEETPFIPAADAASRLMALNDSGHHWSSVALLGVDFVNVLLLFLALGAAGAYVARAARFPPALQVAASVLPLVFALADLGENTLILAAIIPPYDMLAKVADVIGYATGAKLIFFSMSALLVVSGLVVWAVRSLMGRRSS